MALQCAGVHSPPAPLPRSEFRHWVPAYPPLSLRAEGQRNALSRSEAIPRERERNSAQALFPLSWEIASVGRLPAALDAATPSQ